MDRRIRLRRRCWADYDLRRPRRRAHQVVLHRPVAAASGFVAYRRVVDQHRRIQRAHDDALQHRQERRRYPWHPVESGDAAKPRRRTAQGTVCREDRRHGAAVWQTVGAVGRCKLLRDGAVDQRPERTRSVHAVRGRHLRRLPRGPCRGYDPCGPAVVDVCQQGNGLPRVYDLDARTNVERMGRTDGAIVRL